LGLIHRLCVLHHSILHWDRCFGRFLHPSDQKCADYMSSKQKHLGTKYHLDHHHLVKTHLECRQEILVLLGGYPKWCLSSRLRVLQFV